jgi:hypothetical protein
LYLSEIVALCGDKTKEDGACNIPYPNDRNELFLFPQFQI